MTRTDSARLSTGRPGPERRPRPPGFPSPFRRLTKLMIRANAVRDGAAMTGDRICQRMDPVLQELETVRPARTGALASIGAAPSPKGSRGRIAATRRRLVAVCEACGRSFCAPLRQAREAGDALKAKLAYSILRLLEKPLGVLLPQLEAVRLLQPEG